MKEYHDLVRRVLKHGTRKESRTGVDTLSTFGYRYRVDLRDGFPLLTRFMADMGTKPEPSMTLERLDVNKDYEPSNCVWATRKQQARNTRSNILVSYNNETLCIAEWAERLGVTHATLYARIFKYQWPLERALTTALLHKGRGPAK